MKTKNIAYTGLLIALAFVLSYIESLFPISSGVPGAKIGWANIVTLAAIYLLGYKRALGISLVRVLLVAITFGNFAMMMYSLVGALLSFVMMFLAKQSGKFSITGVSVVGGVFHNFGQILVAMVLLDSKELILYFPVLMGVGTVSGVVIGILSGMICSRVKVAI